MEGKARILSEEGRGKRPYKSSSLTNEEVEQFWEHGQVDFHSPLLLYYNYTQVDVFITFSFAG